MRAAAILYTSSTGFTRRYAQLLGEKTGLPVYDLDSSSLPPSGTEVVYLGWVFAGAVKGLGKARRKWRVAAVCAVGMAPPELAAGEGIDKKCGLDGGTAFFYLQGGYAPEKLTGIYRPMMAMMTKKVTKNPPKSPEEAVMQDAFRAGADFVQADSLAPVLAWLEGAA